MMLTSALMRQLWVQRQQLEPLSSAGKQIAGAAKFIVNNLSLPSSQHLSRWVVLQLLAQLLAQAPLAHSMQRGAQYMQGMLSCKSRDGSTGRLRTDTAWLIIPEDNWHAIQAGWM